MIETFASKSLQRLYEKNETKGLPPSLIRRIIRILARLDTARSPEQMNLPGFKLHSLQGAARGFWSVAVSGNWRIVFRFKDGSAFDVELIDYH